MLATVVDTRNNRVAVTIHNKAIQKWPFNHSGTVTFHGVPKLGTILGDIVEVTFFVSSGIFLEEAAIPLPLVKPPNNQKNKILFFCECGSISCAEYIIDPRTA